MDSLYTALSLALIRNKRFALTTNSYASTIQQFRTLVVAQVCQIDSSHFVEIDVYDAYHQDKNFDRLLLRMCAYSKSHPVLRTIVIWRNMQLLDHPQQKQLYQLLLELDQYDTNASRLCPSDTLKVRDLSVRTPTMFTIIAVLEHQYYDRKMYQYLKEKFWFSFNYVYESESVCMKEADSIRPVESYQEEIVACRNNWHKIHVSPDIKKYIYSLIVFMRNHRLASLAPKQTRLSTRAIDEIRDLTVALVLWRNDPDSTFATPDYVKVATRKVGYWLVDWECNKVFTSNDPAKDDLRRQEIDILAGDWYGSDFRYVEKYLDQSQSLKNDASPTGFTNVIVEDALNKVTPPI